MKKLFLILAISSVLLTCATAPKGGKFHERGVASWYGAELQGHKTASGEPFDMNQLTAAHRTLPFGTTLWVRSRSTKRQVLVRINDRGPFAHHRVIDLSHEAARQLGILQKGEDDVELFIVSDS